MNALPRSYLFVPGHRADRYHKAMAAGADAVVLDLEDAVPATDKAAARQAVAAWLRDRAAASAGPNPTAEARAPQVVVRVNAADTPDFETDVGACAQVGPGGLQAVMLPKSERAAELERLARALPGLSLLPLVETARGIAAASEIAAAPAVQRLVFGSIDLQHDLGIDGDGEELLLFRSTLVLQSRLAGIAAPVDGVSTAFDDPERVHAETVRGRRLGFGAKLCIHPKQLAPVHQGFAPTPAQIDWAQRVLAAAAASGGAAIALDGAMVDRPVILRAQSILARAT